MAVSNVLKIRRKELDYTLLDIAKKVGVSEATVQRWESGNIKNLRYDKIIALSEVLNISPAQLMGWDNDSSHDSSQILSIIEQLNAEGQEKVLNYAKDLVSSGNYKSTSSSALVEESREISERVSQKMRAQMVD